jgi:hypothetical protein
MRTGAQIAETSHRASLMRRYERALDEGRHEEVAELTEQLQQAFAFNEDRAPTMRASTMRRAETEEKDPKDMSVNSAERGAQYIVDHPDEFTETQVKFAQRLLDALKPAGGDREEPESRGGDDDDDDDGKRPEPKKKDWDSDDMRGLSNEQAKALAAFDAPKTLDLRANAAKILRGAGRK